MMNFISLICPICGCTFDKAIGHYNRAMKQGLKVYCNRTCAGIGRRTYKSTDQKKQEKSEYDKKYKNREYVKKKRSESFKKDYKENPEKYRKERQRRMKDHVEYCRNPQYKEYKKKYDRQHCAKKNYGEFWEAALLVIQIEKEVDNFQAKQDNNLINKSQKRKRQWKTSQQRT